MAATSVLKLVVDDKEYSASLKNAKQGMQALQDSLQNAGKTFLDVDKRVVEYARALGQMETTSKSAKGKIGEMSSAFVDLSIQYKHLTDQEKQSPLGKAMSESLDTLKTRVIDAKQELADFENQLKDIGDVKINTAGGGWLGGLGDKMSGAFQVFAGNMLTKAAGAVANLGSEMYGMVQQGVELAKQGEGIRIAFERLGRGDILDGLRQATHGTVTDLELMKAAVKFNDFKLPLDQLGTMLAFAQQKAKDTGQSVDYMVESITNGLGRQSKPILDNLGISAKEIEERMKSTGDFTKAVGEIIRDQMKAAGDYIETAADRAAQANVSLQNKMEELGRKFAPVEEASNQLWTSMKIGILDIIGGPLATLLNQLTEAGRLKNMLNNMNGEPGSGNTKVDQQLKKLNVIKKGGGSDYIFNSTLNGMMEDYNRQIMALDTQIKNGGKRQGAGSGESQDVRYLQQKMDALKIMRDQLAAGAKELSKPVDVKIETKGAEQSVESLKVKLIELEAQRKKAIAAGDTDLSKNLAKQISQVKSDIKGLNPNALETTGGSGHKTTPQEKAADIVANAERTYAETLQKSAIRMEVGLDSTLEGKKKELSAQERLFDAYNDAYATYADPKYKDAASDAADKIKSLAGEVKSMEDAVKASKVKWEQGASGFNAQTMGVWMQGRQSDLSKAEYGSADYSSIMANIADMNTIKTVLEQSVKAGIDAAQFDLSSLWEKVFDGNDIPDTVWQGIVNEINKKLKSLNIEPIKIDLKTGNIKGLGDDAKVTAKEMQSAAGAISSVGAALNSIEDPAAKVAGLVAQAIATVIQAYASALDTDWTSKTSIYSFIAAAAAGTASMLTTVASIHSATGYAEGGIIKGNSYSGDNIGGLVDGSQLVGLNAGEVVLNAAGQQNLAANLQGAGSLRGLNLRTKVKGTELLVWLDNSLAQSGRGELVTWGP